MHFMWQNWHDQKQQIILFSLMCNIYSKHSPTYKKKKKTCRIIVDEQTMRFTTRLPPFTSHGPTKTEQNGKSTSDTTVKATDTRILQNRVLLSLDCLLYLQLFYVCELLALRIKYFLIFHFKHFNVKVFNLLLINNFKQVQINSLRI